MLGFAAAFGSSTAHAQDISKAFESPRPPQITAPASIDKYLTLDFIKSLTRLLDKENIPSESRARNEWLYGRLYALRTTRVSFVTTLEDYERGRRQHLSRLEMDYKLNAVGEASSRLDEELAHFIVAFQSIGAKVSIDDPQIEEGIDAYTAPNQRLVGGILDEHLLSGISDKNLRRIVVTAEKNGELLNAAIDQLLQQIRAERTKPKPDPK